MAATRLIPLHRNKGKTLLQTLKERTDYAQNPESVQLAREGLVILQNKNQVLPFWENLSNGNSQMVRTRVVLDLVFL